MDQGIDNTAWEADDEVDSETVAVKNQSPEPVDQASQLDTDQDQVLIIEPVKDAAQRQWRSPDDEKVVVDKSNLASNKDQAFQPAKGHQIATVAVSLPPPASLPIQNVPSSTENKSANSANSVNNNNSEGPTVVDFDDVLPHVGEFGPYQIILFFLTAPFCFFLAFSYFSQVFITLIPDHWCDVPELNFTGMTREQIRNLSIPRLEPAFIGAPDTFDSCNMYDVSYTEVIRLNLRPNSTWKTIPCRNGWQYDLEQTRYPTIVSEYNWVCQESSKPPLAQAIFFIGSIAGGIIFGYGADRFGRIPALIICNMVGAVAGIITTFSYNFGVFAFSRFLMGMAFDNCFTMMYILVLEYVGPKYRTVVANLSIALFYTAGTTILPWIAWAIRDWRMFSLATAVPMAISLAAYWIVPESARWLLSQGQTDRAIQILRSFARINKKQVDERIYNELKEATDEARQASANEPSRSVLDLFKTPRLRRNTILLTLLWAIITVVYDGHARNTANLGLSVFVTFSVASVTELPADLVLVFFLDRWGRRALAFGSLFFASVFSLATLLVPIQQAAAAATVAIIGRLCVNITYNIGLQYGAELIPTEVRAQGIAAVHIFGYVAAIVSPYIVDLGRISRTLPLTILGILAMIGGIIGLMLPETLNTVMPQTMEDGENFGRDQSFWDFPCCSLRRTKKRTAPIVETSLDAQPLESKTWLRNSLRTSVRGETLRSSLLIKTAATNTAKRKETLRRIATARN